MLCVFHTLRYDIPEPDKTCPQDGTDNEGATDKEEQRGGEGAEGEAGGGGGGGKSGAEDKPAGAKKSTTRGDHYDYTDDFIDDEGMF